MADLGLRKMISDNKVTQLEGQSTEQVMPAKNDRNKEEHSEPGTTVLMRVGVAVIRMWTDDIKKEMKWVVQPYDIRFKVGNFEVKIKRENIWRSHCQ